MRRAHFEALRPLCPTCRGERERDAPLVLAHVTREEGDLVVEGTLHCSHHQCQHEYPIVDGIPVLVPQLASYLGDNLFHLLARDDLSEGTESLLGDCLGPGTWFDTTRQQLSTYTWDHWGDLDPNESATTHPRSGAVLRCLELGLEHIGTVGEGPAIDVGCSVGRTTFMLAERQPGLVIGVDANLAMLRLAQRVLRTGSVRYPRRRVGIVYDRREFPVTVGAAERVDFWACDAMALPFSHPTFGQAVAMNVLDCVASPLTFLGSLRHLLRSGGRAVLSTPYDWSPGATPLEGWIGGHSQRGTGGGASEPFLRSLLTSGAHAQSIDGLRIVADLGDIPWHARLHDRSTVAYTAHMMVVEAV